MLRLKLQYFGNLMRRVDSLEKPWCWEGLGAGGEGDNRGWDGWMASPTQCTWVWVNSRSWWWTGRPGVLWFMGSKRVGPGWVTELNWTEPSYKLLQNLYHSLTCLIMYYLVCLLNSTILLLKQWSYEFLKGGSSIVYRFLHSVIQHLAEHSCSLI